MQDRKIISVTGADREEFLQNLVTNDVKRLKDGLVWTALLSPQGKYLADFFLVPADDAILIDVAEPLAAGLLQRLSMYKLRANVTLTPTDKTVARGIGPTPDGAFADPRHPDLGWRAYDGRAGEDHDWDALRVRHMIPESGIELIPNESYPLETRFEALNGVDFRKGCYVGQEVTARMKHKSALKKGLAQVKVEGEAEAGAEITLPDGRTAGQLHTRSGNDALAYLRFDRAGETLRSGNATVIAVLSEPSNDP
jgi:hypothetical protein